MDISDLVKKVRALTDLELAMLLCLVVDQSCIIQSEQTELQNLEEELRVVCRSCLRQKNIC